MNARENAKKNAPCNTCTAKLVALAYRRAPWFRLCREPLKLGMRLLSRLHRVDPGAYELRTPRCRKCIRFYKIALKEKSALFRWLNDRGNPRFDTLMGRIVAAEEIARAKAYARAATAGEVSPKEAEAWMAGNDVNVFGYRAERAEPKRIRRDSKE